MYVQINSYEDFYLKNKQYDLFKDNTIAKDFANFLEKNISAKTNPSANFILNGKYEYVVSQINKDMLNLSINLKFFYNDNLIKEINFLQ